MSAAALAGRPDALALRRIGLLSRRFYTSNNSVPSGPRAPRSAYHSHRKPVPQCLASRAFFNPRYTIRPNSTATPKNNNNESIAQRFRIKNIIFKSFAYCGFFIVMSGAVVVAFFIYDATTYREGPSAEDIPVSELALNPRYGGPKNLPVAEVLVGDNDSDAMQAQRDKPRLVILGTGWGSIALLKHLNPGDYHVTVVSPTNYFLFTPMLPSATVGTLGLRSLVEPVRRIVQRVHGHFLKGEATDVDFSEKLVEISQVNIKGEKEQFYLPYDKLVVGVGQC